MDTLSKKNDFDKMFHDFIDSIMSTNSDDFNSMTTLIKNNMMLIGSKLFEEWILLKIGTGKKANTFFKNSTDNKSHIKYRFKGYHEKIHLSILGEIKIKKAYYSGNELKSGYYPIEEDYPVLKDYCLPDVKEFICFSSCLNPYELTKDVISKLSNIKISTAEIQKVTKNVGDKLIEIDDEAINNPIIETESSKKIDKMVISMDGAMINTHNDWKEVKSGVIYEIKGKDSNLVSLNKSYVSKIEDSASFGKRIKSEARRRHYLKAKEHIVIGDGAVWIWNLADKEFPFSIKIVDWYHAKEHLHKIADLLFEKNADMKKKFEIECSDYLYKGKIKMIEDLLNRKKIELNIVEPNILSALRTEMEYFLKNRDRMQYQEFELKKYPIGSGVMEATCKQLVQLRLKRNGMIWNNDGAHCILIMRCLYLSNRWGEVKEVCQNAA